MSEHWHISSLVLRADPARLDDVVRSVESLANAKIAIADPSGRIVVTLDTGSEDEIVRAMSAMQHFEGVLNASLVFHHAEEATAPDTAVVQGENR